MHRKSNSKKFINGQKEYIFPVTSLPMLESEDFQFES